MDSSVFKHPNLLLAYGIKLKNSKAHYLDNVKMVKQAVDLLFKFKLMRIDAMLKKTDAEEDKKVLLDTAEQLKVEYNKMKNSEDLYELIYFYIKYSYDEQLDSIKRRNLIVRLKDELEYAHTNFLSSEDVKYYVEVVLPLIEHADLNQINQTPKSTEQFDASSLKYVVLMHKTPRLLIDEKDEDEAMRVYSFGSFQYRTVTLGDSTIYEILGIVKKYPDGSSKANSVIMYLNEDVELEVKNMIYQNPSNVQTSLKISTKDTIDGKSSIIYTRKPSDIPADAVDFYRNIVFSDFILANALNNQFDFVGHVIETEESQGRYGKYKLVFEDPEAEELLDVLQYAKTHPGIIKGIDTTFYGNDLNGVLLNVKYASLSKAEKMECKEKEIGITQGEE